MRQTSRAVALLLVLESAQATATTIATDDATNFNLGAKAGQLDTTAQLTSRTAPWNNKGALTSANATYDTNLTWSAAASNKISTMVVANEAAASLNGSSSPCVACIAGAGVWCSRTYSYNYSGTINYQVGTTTANTGFLKANLPTDLATSIGGTDDNGACCAATALEFSAYVATSGVEVDKTNVTNFPPATAQAMLDLTCPAVVQSGAPNYSATTGATWGKYKLDVVSTAAYKSWWCSNGTFNSATGSSNNTTNGVQVFGLPQISTTKTNTLAVNARQELATVGCPQRSKACGTNVLVNLDASSPVLTVEMDSTLNNTNSGSDGKFMTPSDKCTWVAYSVKNAPSFTIAKKATYGLVTAAWQLHQMEYTVAATWDASQGSLLQQPTDGIYTTSDSVNKGNYVPLFNMPSAQFSTLRTWYGQGFGAVTSTALAGQNPNWYAPGYNNYSNALADVTVSAMAGTQMWGNVANIPYSTFGTTSATTTPASPATATYGTISTTASFDFRQVRFLPAQVPTTVYAQGKDVQTKYSTALTAYNTAKTTWDAYVAILEKNSKQDAFAAAFSPPKAPTVPPLPNMPWQPAAYAGYVKQTAVQAGAMAWNNSKTLLIEAAQPTGAAVFANLAAAQTIGGWGSFTAQIFTFREGWGKSFGTIGYSADSNKLAMGQVWNYKWMCAANTSTYTAGNICDANYDYSSAAATATTIAATQLNANTVPMVSVVTLWALGNNGSLVTSTGAGTWNGKQDFKLTWAAGAWSNSFAALTVIAAPTAPVAAKSLSGLAGAQALAASTAAVLAAAAALY